MSEHSKIAFIDAYGNTDLETVKKGASTHFIITGVIVEKKYFDEFNTKIQAIRDKRCKGRPLKSSKIRSHKQRELILSDISKLNFKFISIVIDKSKLKSPGYKFPKSFVKNLHLPLHKSLLKSYKDILIEQDSYGDQEFMAGYSKYLDNQFPIDIFNYANFKFGKSDNSSGIQIADFISGSLSKHFDSKKKTEHSENYLEILKPQLLYFEELPYKTKELISHFDDDDVNYDNEIANASLNAVDSYIYSNEDSKDSNVILKIKILQYLKYNLNHSPEDYIYSNEIIDFLDDVSLDERFFKSLIGDLRNAGILISTCNKGYKLAITEEECITFIEHFNNVIDPMLSRIEESRKIVSTATFGKVDILSSPKFNRLKKALDRDTSSNNTTTLPKKIIPTLRKPS